MRWHTVAARLAAVLASLALLGGCAAGSTPSASPSPSAPLVTPSASPSPLATPSPAPSMPEEPISDLAWYSIGSLPVAVADRPVVGFSKGYVAVERWSNSVWFSADGRTWREIELPFKVTKDKYGRPMEARANAVTTNETQVLVVGGYTHKPCRAPEPPGSVSTGGGPECPLYPIAWVSNDGITWESAYPGPRPADPPGYDQGSEFVAAWPLPTGGWDAALSCWQGESLHGRDLWHSSDGIRWTQLEPAPALDTGDSDKFPWVHAGAADAEGIRVLWQGWSDFTAGQGVPVMTLATSPDGLSWASVADFAGHGTDIRDGVAPTGGHSRWILAGGSGIGEDYTTSVPTVWTSEDRVTWTATVLPFDARAGCAADESLEECGGAYLTSVVPTRAGYVAVSAEATWLSEDGLVWVELPPVATQGTHGNPATVADGPAGVIGIGVGPTGSEDTITVWQLR